jgi:23S rRNA pseudouridine1911/1915/1917 synthase
VKKEIEIKVEETGERLDKYIASRLPRLSRSAIKRLIEKGLVAVEGKVRKASYKVKAGEEISILVPKEEPLELRAESIPLDVIYEDEDVIVVVKPAGMVVHPSCGHNKGTLAGAILALCPDLAGVGERLRPGIVHRLDKDTSGLVVVAKNEGALRNLREQFKKREVKKVYVALVEGRLEPERGAIEAPIGRDPRQRKKMSVVRGGRYSLTLYKVVEYFDEHTLLEVEPKTGRTHQVRVHLSFIGHPLVGDPIYGFRKQRLNVSRQFLHARTLGFRLPSGEYVEFEAKLPEDLKRVLDRLRGN